MKKLHKIFLIFFLLILIVIGFFVTNYLINPIWDGGPCSYETYAGTVTITSVKKLENNTDYCENISNCYEVIFVLIYRNSFFRCPCIIAFFKIPLLHRGIEIIVYSKFSL